MVSDASLRPNEQTVDLAPADDAVLRFIGTIRTPWSVREDCPRQGRQDGPECRLVLDAPWHAALRGLEEYETIEVLYWLDRSRRDLATQSPRGDGRTTGTFALRSPVRPNPIGTSRVKLVRIRDGTVFVRGLDCLDGTPLLDIKPDRCAFGLKAQRSGLMSSSGVPSRQSRPRTISVPFSIRTSLTMDVPIGLGRTGDRRAKVPKVWPSFPGLCRIRSRRLWSSQ